MLIPATLFAQRSDSYMQSEADTIKNETNPRNNNATRLVRLWKNMISNKWNGQNLTTTGSTGPASFNYSTGTLNIPNYSASSVLPADANGVLQNNGAGIITWGNVKNLYTGAGGGNGNIPYWNGTNYSYTAVGSSGNVLTSVGGGAPVFTDLKSMATSWTTITLTGSWSVSGGSTLQWRYSANGRVELRGRLDSTGTSSSVVTGSSAVPAPVDANGVAVAKIPIVNETDATFAYVQISSLGVISILPYNAGKIYTLNGVSYLASY